jgi:hypothetical protein
VGPFDQESSETGADEESEGDAEPTAILPVVEPGAEDASAEGAEDAEEEHGPQ